jgi:hypothetical protein
LHIFGRSIPFGVAAVTPSSQVTVGRPKAGLILAGTLCVRARGRPISKLDRGTQIILKKFYQREKLVIFGKLLDLSWENPFGFGPKQNKLTDSLGFSDWRHMTSHLSHEISMGHIQNCKNWSELKTQLGKNCTIDKLNSEGPPNIRGTRARNGRVPTSTLIGWPPTSFTTNYVKTGQFVQNSKSGTCILHSTLLSTTEFTK